MDWFSRVRPVHRGGRSLHRADPLTGGEPPLLGPRYRYERDCWNSLLHPVQVAACRGAQREMDGGEMSFESVGCLCGETAGVLISTRDWFGFHHPLRLCHGCGLLRQEVRLTASSLARFYRDWYRAVYEVPNPDGVEAELALRLSLGKRRFHEISSVVPMQRGSTVVDIGCNYGSLLAPFRDAGMDVWGCDFGEEHLEVGRQRLGLPQLVVGNAEALVSLGVRADLILLDHAFEHFADPVTELRRLDALLAPGGRVFVVVPGTWWWTQHICSGDFLSLLQNAHVFQYDLRTLQATFAGGGFSLESGDERVVAVFRRADGGHDPRAQDGHAAAKRDAKRLLRLERRRRLRAWGRDVLCAASLYGAVTRLRRFLATPENR